MEIFGMYTSSCSRSDHQSRRIIHRCGSNSDWKKKKKRSLTNRTRASGGIVRDDAGSRFFFISTTAGFQRWSVALQGQTRSQRVNDAHRYRTCRLTADVWMLVMASLCNQIRRIWIYIHTTKWVDIGRRNVRKCCFYFSLQENQLLRSDQYVKSDISIRWCESAALCSHISSGLGSLTPNSNH